MHLRTSAQRIFSGRLPQTDFGWGGSAASEIGRSTYPHHVCVTGAYHKRETCCARMHHKAEGVEARVWSVVSRILKDPGRLRAGLDYMIEQESRGAHGVPASGTKRWLEEFSEEGRKGARHQ
jgi:hypothetical protein